MLAYIALIIAFIIIAILLTVALVPQSATDMMDPIDETTFPFPIFIINLDRKPERYEYVTKQLDNLGLTGYSRVSATDGFKVDLEEMTKVGVSTHLYGIGKGLAGCATSHIKMWHHIADNNLGWTLILEDDAHFHPQFRQLFPKYWNQTPKEAKIIFVGYCNDRENSTSMVLSNNVGCLQGYMVSAEGARHLLNNLLPMAQPIDDAIGWHFRMRRDSYVFNGNVTVDGVRPYDYKEINGHRCQFNGIIYQNQEQQGSTIHSENTIF